MASSYSGKNTFGSKVKGLVRKTALSLAFAAAVGGPAYHYYISSENVEAKVLSVEPVSSYSENVITDKGTFVNQTTWAYGKGEKEVANIASVLQPGNTVEITVYGATPKVGNLTLEDFNIHKNITKAKLISGTVAAPSGDNTVTTPNNTGPTTTGR
ncbi:MAG: hypothetical protein HY052_07610 [Proteobacteria bacterium]|nr:hypothetical protein [Pseudomonadota bacterium]